MASDQYTLTPVGSHISNTALGSAQALATPVAGASHLLIQALTQNVRYTLDGTTPTATVGFRLTADDDPVLIGWSPGVVVTVIQEAAGAAVQGQWVRL